MQDVVGRQEEMKIIENKTNCSGFFENLTQGEKEYERLEKKYHRAVRSAEYWEKKFCSLLENPARYREIE